MKSRVPKPRRARKPAVKKPTKPDEHSKATLEEFEREGLGVAAKE